MGYDISLNNLWNQKTTQENITLHNECNYEYEKHYVKYSSLIMS